MNKLNGAKRHIAVLILILTVFSFAQTVFADNAPRLIAHAGGVIYGIRLTNSLQAMNNSYGKGFRYIELDMDWTLDNIPVLVHDWGNANWFANIKHSTKPQTFYDFKRNKAILNLQMMDLDSLEKWCLQHTDAKIISDIKSENIKLLGIIKDKYPGIYSSLIPQIYSFEEYDSVKGLGYKSIILTLYRLGAAGKDILCFCRNHSLFGVAIYADSAQCDLLDELHDMGIRAYIHTVNEYNQYVKLREKGAYGIYTDYLEPCSWVE